MLRKIDGVRKVEAVNDGWLLESVAEDDLRKRVARFAQENNILLVTLKKEEKSLEEVFKNLTNK